MGVLLLVPKGYQFPRPSTAQPLWGWHIMHTAVQCQEKNLRCPGCCTFAALERFDCHFPYALHDILLTTAQSRAEKSAVLRLPIFVNPGVGYAGSPPLLAADVRLAGTLANVREQSLGLFR